jgi:uncharacterized membrane protein
MKVSWPAEAVQLTLIAGMVLLAAVVWPHVPDRIPVHWNLQGEVDRYGGKFVGLMLIPLITAGVYLLLILLPLFDPGRRNYQSFAGAYNAIRVSIVAFMTVVDVVIVLVALGNKVDVTAVIAIATGAMLVVLGNFMGKIRPNWFVGVRTPWTLSSKLSWTKTHRLAGWLFILMGLLVAVLGIIKTGWMLVLTLSVCGLMSVWIVVYSYLVYRHDPQRISPAGTVPDTP